MILEVVEFAWGFLHLYVSNDLMSRVRNDRKNRRHIKCLFVSPRDREILASRPSIDMIEEGDYN